MIAGAPLVQGQAGGRLAENVMHFARVLRSAGIAPVGVGENLRAASTPAVVERDGWRIAVLGFGGVVPAADWLAGPMKLSPLPWHTPVRRGSRSMRRRSSTSISIGTTKPCVAAWPPGPDRP